MFEIAELLPHRTGEATFLMTEQRRLDQVGRDCTAVDGDEVSVRTLALFVDRTCDQILAGPALAYQQYRRFGARHARDLPVKTFHRRRGAVEQAE